MPESTAPSEITTDVLIIGTGPAGASLASFLSYYGVKGHIVSAASSVADTPRAHYTNPGALECLRDIGLEAECRKQGSASQEVYKYVRWVNTMAGEQYARMRLRGHDPRRWGDYFDASPCELMDLPQTLLEPILTNYATIQGFHMRWNTRYVSAYEDELTNTVVTTLLDMDTKQEFKIRSRFLAGADGARSEIVRQLGLTLHESPGKGVAYNVLIDADMTHLVEHSQAVLHFLTQPDRENPEWAWQGICRMVTPWKQWLFILYPAPGANKDVEVTQEQWVQRCRDFIGDDSVEITFRGMSKWRINEVYADTYSKGNIFCLGDAVHRHPPNNGFGSNTCIQDAYNLAWKLAYVLQGKAGRTILDSYSPERQPVGKGIVKYANTSMAANFKQSATLGFDEITLERRLEVLKEMGADTDEGRQRRIEWRKGVGLQDYQFSALGQELNQRYQSSAVYLDDEKTGPPQYEKDPALFYQSSTYPGSRLPHAWLNRAIAIKPLSTHDLAGKGGFALFTGIGGKEAWAAAAEKVSKHLGVPIKVTSIGWRQDYEDPDFAWERQREVSEHGAVLVRPDRFVAWRCQDTEGATVGKLETVMRKVLGLEAYTNGA